MSNEALSWAYRLPLKGPAKPVLTALADFADEAGSCYPGQEKLALMTGLSLRSVSRALARLEDQGLLRREHRYDRRGYRTSDRYFLSLDVQVLPVTVPTGHSDYRSHSPRLHATQSTPTGHSDRVTISRTTRKNPQGGANARTPTPDPVDNPAPPTPQVVPWCKRHAATEGSDRPCAACRKAREAHLLWEQEMVAGSCSDTWQPVKATSKAWKPGLCIHHLQKLGECEMCEREGIA